MQLDVKSGQSSVSANSIPILETLFRNLSPHQCRVPLRGGISFGEGSPAPRRDSTNHQIYNPGNMSTTLKEAALDLASIRAQFPSLSQTINGQPAVFLDGPGGTQVPQRVIDAISDYLKFSNANTNGAYATSYRTNATIEAARTAMANLFNSDPDEIVFGPNMTTLTYA